MGAVLRFGIPTLDELLGQVETTGMGGITHGIELNDVVQTTSLCAMGPDGTGKSLLMLHLASHYLADSYRYIAGLGSEGAAMAPPAVLYVSTDFTFAKAERAWNSFRLCRPNSRDVPFRSQGVNRFEIPPPDFELKLVQLRPDNKAADSISEFLATLERSTLNATSGSVGFVDLATRTAGDEWGFLNRLIASLANPTEGLRSLVVIDAVEGFETLAGTIDSYGQTSSRRSRIAQVLRSAATKCHLAFVVEEPQDGSRVPEEFVTDTVIRLRTATVKNYVRRTVEIEKIRGQSPVPGQQPYVIRHNRGSSTGTQENVDDPKVQNSYIHVFHSLHTLSRGVLERVLTITNERQDHIADKYAAFGVPNLDDMLAGASVLKRDRGSDSCGLPAGSTSALIGDAGTKKSALGNAFLSRCFSGYVVRLVELTREIRGDDTAEKRFLDILAKRAGRTEGRQIINKINGLLPKFQRDKNTGKTTCDILQWKTFVRTIQQSLEATPPSGVPGSSFHEEPPFPLDRIVEDPWIGAIRLASWLLDHRLTLHPDDGIPVLITTQDVHSKTLAEFFYPWFLVQLKSLLPSVLPEEQSVFEEELKRRVHGRAICRRLEIHDASSETVMHIVRCAIYEAHRAIRGAEPHIEAEIRAQQGWRIRVVIDDFSTFKETYPEIKDDSLFLPFLLFYLGREGTTNLIIDTHSGTPDTAVSEHFDSQLRALVSHRIYSWRVPFYGEQRIAIAAVPPIGSKPVRVRELKWNFRNTGTRIEVDRDFELYSGLEKGNPTPVPLDVRIWAETPAANQYVKEVDALFMELFTPAGDSPVRGGAVRGVGVDEYRVLRDLCHLQRRTHRNETLIFQVEDFWALRRPRDWALSLEHSLREQVEYLHTITHNGKVANFQEDPFRAFQPTSAEPRGPDASLKVSRRRDFFPMIKTDYHSPGDKEKFAKLHPDRVPFMWDFGFLLCKESAWRDAGHLKLYVDGSPGLEVSDVWQALTPGQTPSKPQAASWRVFLEASMAVARHQGTRSSEHVTAFDLSMLGRESLACLVFEMWASEVYQRRVRRRARIIEWLSTRSWIGQGEYGLKFALTNYAPEFFRVMILLTHVLEISQLSDTSDPFRFRVREASRDANAVRHWYATACAWQRPNDGYVPMRLPGHFSVRGDWFLAVAQGSRSERLADRALDLLSTRTANFRRLQLGLGLPVRDVLPEENHNYLRTALMGVEGGRSEHVSYETLRNAGANEEAEFHWLWRSQVAHYNRQAVVWQKWLFRLLVERARLKAEAGDLWWSGFDLYDLLRNEQSGQKISKILQSLPAGSRFNTWELFKTRQQYILQALSQSIALMNETTDATPDGAADV